MWDELRRIPAGETRSYADVSERIGRPTAVRAVANANRLNRCAIILPCHRVIGSDGTLTGYAGGLWRKQWLLDHERRVTGKTLVWRPCPTSSCTTTRSRPTRRRSARIWATRASSGARMSVPAVPPRPELNLMTGGNRRIPGDADRRRHLPRLEHDLAHAGEAAPRARRQPQGRLPDPSDLPAVGAAPDDLPLPLRFRVREDAASAFSSPEEMVAFRADRAPFMAPAADISKNAEFGPLRPSPMSACTPTGSKDSCDRQAPLRARPLPRRRQASPADFSAFHGFWWLKPSSARQDLFGKLETLWTWVDRMEALDQGRQAHAHHRGRSPRPGEGRPARLRASQRAARPWTPSPAQAVTVLRTTTARTPSAAILSQSAPITSRSVAKTSETGPLHPHFPRWGYRLTLAGLIFPGMTV